MANAVAVEDLIPLLARLADQSEAAAASQRFPETTEAIPEGQRAAWLHVLESIERCESVEADLMEPVLDGLKRCGLDAPDVLRFYTRQCEDEDRHGRLVQAYTRLHYGERPRKVSFMTRLLYDRGLPYLAERSRNQPIFGILPIYVLERCGAIYFARLTRCAGEANLPLLQGLLQDIHRDEARHVAAVGATVQLLLATPLPAGDRRALRWITWLIVKDMDRTAWWKPGLAERMAALGLDAAGMDRENAGVLREVHGLLEGHG